MASGHDSEGEEDFSRLILSKAANKLTNSPIPESPAFSVENKMVKPSKIDIIFNTSNEKDTDNMMTPINYHKTAAINSPIMHSFITPDKEGTNELIEQGDSLVFRKLLRAPRYFTSQEDHFLHCSNCGAMGHVLKECKVVSSSRRCILCGLNDHFAKNCPDKNKCRACNKPGHLARDCKDVVFSKSNSKPSQTEPKSTHPICQLCGSSDHYLKSCQNGIPALDFEKVKCFVCDEYGHLNCGKFSILVSDQPSCYMCGRKGHAGYDCHAPAPSSDFRTPDSGMKCHSCQKIGHKMSNCPLNKRNSWPLKTKSNKKKKNHHTNDSMHNSHNRFIDGLDMSDSDTPLFKKKGRNSYGERDHSYSDFDYGFHLSLRDGKDDKDWDGRRRGRGERESSSWLDDRWRFADDAREREIVGKDSKDVNKESKAGRRKRSRQEREKERERGDGNGGERDEEFKKKEKKRKRERGAKDSSGNRNENENGFGN